MGNINKKDIEFFDEEGFIIIRDYLSKDIFFDLLKVFNYALFLQILKAYPQEDYVKNSKDPNAYTELDDLDWACQFLFENDQDAFRTSQQLVGQSTHSVLNRLREEVLKIVAPLLDCLNELFIMRVVLYHEGGTLS